MNRENQNPNIDIDVTALFWYHILYVENDAAIRLNKTNT